MCETSHDDITPAAFVDAGTRKLPVVDLNDMVEELLPVARFIAGEPEVRRTGAGFIGYGSTKPGDKVLLAADTHYDWRVVEATARALRERGAKVDVVTVDVGPDRDFTDAEEINTVMRREPWENHPRRWEGVPWVEELALRGKYDLLCHGKGGSIPQTPHRYEAFPWLTSEHFTQPATTYPRKLHTAINVKAWQQIRENGRGGRVHLTDPEGTDLRWTLWDEYFDGIRLGSGETPFWGHLMSHPPTPIISKEDATGLAAGTTSHFARPFPHIRVSVQDGLVQTVEGGGAYGKAWTDLLHESRNTQYPCFPRPGLFWFWEAAIGTNPKISRPSRIHRVASGGFEWERRRSGVIHLGFGTFWRGPEERWAGERGLLYGHLHVHLLFPTLVIETRNGKSITVIDNGRLTAMDDPEIRAVASEFGDPDELLREEWSAPIPGISAPGSYDEYAANPAKWIYAL